MNTTTTDEVVKTLERSTKLLGNTTGRDRVNRFVQFFTKFLAVYLQDKVEKETVDKLAKVNGNVGQARKLMRIGRQIEFLLGAKKSVAIHDHFIKYTTLGKQVSLSIWLLFDTIQWMQSVGIVNSTKESKEAVTKKALKFWFFGLCNSILCGLYKLRNTNQRTIQESKAMKVARQKGVSDEEAERSYKLLTKQKRTLIKGIVHDGCDMTIPLLLLDKLPSFVPPWLIFGLAAVTSVTGGTQLWHNTKA